MGLHREWPYQHFDHHETDASNLPLLKCWELPTALEDPAFKDIIVRIFFTEAKTLFWGRRADFAFHADKISSAEKSGFVVEVL